MSGVCKSKGIRVNNSETIMHVCWDWTSKKRIDEGGSQVFHCWRRLQITKERKLE